MPNSIVVSRGCPHVCDFCYKEAFFEGGKSFYTQTVDDALAEIERLPGRHLYFLDDHLFGNPRFASEPLRRACAAWGGSGRRRARCSRCCGQDCWSRRWRAGCAASSSASRRSIPPTCSEQHKYQNLDRDYTAAIRRLHDLGVMVNGSFVFGMDDDDESVFDRTVEWAIAQGIETATFHILTPYPGTALYTRMAAQGRLLHRDWDLYDTRHVVFRPAKLTPEALEAGTGARTRLLPVGLDCAGCLDARALGRATAPCRRTQEAGRSCEPMWDMIIRAKRASRMLPVLETVLSAFGSRRPTHQVERARNPIHANTN